MSYKVLFICLFTTICLYAQDTLVNTGQQWKYIDGDIILPDNWYKNPVHLEKWKLGKSPLGYGRPDVNTAITAGGLNKVDDLVSYFMLSFYINEPSENLAYEIRLKRDDGALVYINGYEIWRSNMKEGKGVDELPHAQNDIYEEDESIYIRKMIPSEEFNHGINIICVAVYQRRSVSNDCIFDLQLIEHNEAAIIPELLKMMDEETFSLKNKLTEVLYTEEINERDNEIMLLKQSSDFNTLIRNIAFFAILALLLLLLLVFRQHSAKLKNRDAKVSSLKKRVDNAQNELLNNSIANVKYNRFLKEMKESLGEYLNNNNQNILHKLISSINSISDDEEDWQNLEVQFNVVNAGFVNRLRGEYPTLTPTELRHCIFIKLLFATKDIAKLMGIEPRSVQSVRYRIKKKIGLSEEEDLKKFLIDF